MLMQPTIDLKTTVWRNYMKLLALNLAVNIINKPLVPSASLTEDLVLSWIVWI